jgi:hypothetical protein
MATYRAQGAGIFLEARMARHDIRTVTDLRAVPPAQWQAMVAALLRWLAEPPPGQDPSVFRWETADDLDPYSNVRDV